MIGGLHWSDPGGSDDAEGQEPAPNVGGASTAIFETLSSSGRRLFRAVDSIDRPPASTRMRMRVTRLGIAAVLLGLITGSPARGATEAQHCAAAKMKAAGKATECLLVIDAKAAAGSPI